MMKKKQVHRLLAHIHYADDLDASHYFVLKTVYFGNEGAYTGYDAQKFFIFGYVKSSLEQMVDEYGETHHLSEADCETIQLFCDEFRGLSEEITENPNMSKEKFAECIDKLYTSVYLRQ